MAVSDRDQKNMYFQQQKIWKNISFNVKLRVDSQRE